MKFSRHILISTIALSVLFLGSFAANARYDEGESIGGSGVDRDTGGGGQGGSAGEKTSTTNASGTINKPNGTVPGGVDTAVTNANGQSVAQRADGSWGLALGGRGNGGSGSNGNGGTNTGGECTGKNCGTGGTGGTGGGKGGTGGSGTGGGGRGGGSSGGVPQCSNGIDDVDQEDTLADRNDPGCYSGADGTYNPNDNDERNGSASSSIPSISCDTTGGNCYKLVNRGNSCTIAWSSQNSKNCSVSGPGLNQTGLPTSGSVTTPPITSASIYTITCFNKVGNGPQVFTAKTFNCRLNPTFEEF